jgi:hypothetical protein
VSQADSNCPKHLTYDGKCSSIYLAGLSPDQRIARSPKNTVQTTSSSLPYLQRHPTPRSTGSNPISHRQTICIVPAMSESRRDRESRRYSRYSTSSDMLKLIRRSTIDTLHSLQFEGESYFPPERPRSPELSYHLETRHAGTPDPEVESIDLSIVKQQPDPSLHLFSARKKKAIIHLMAMAALFSPLSSNIFFPAIETIAKVCKFHISPSPI